MASTLSGRSYGEKDIRWLMENAGSFVVEALERIFSSDLSKGVLGLFD